MTNQDPPDVLLAYFMDNPSPATYVETLTALQQREKRLVLKAYEKGAAHKGIVIGGETYIYGCPKNRIKLQASLADAVKEARINEAIKAIDIMIEPTKKFTGQDGPLIKQFASIMMKQKNRITSLKAKEKS